MIPRTIILPIVRKTNWIDRLLYCLLAIGIATLAAGIVLLGSIRADAAEFGPATDQAGNVYPAECPDSLVDDPAWQARMTIKHAAIATPNVMGLTLNTLVDGKAFIVISPRVAGWKERDVIRHEMCHGRLLLEGKPINFHPHQSDYIPNARPAERCADPFHC